MNKTVKFLLSTATLLLFFSKGYAHTPLFDCFDNGDESITCEGGFSDGTSVAGIGVRVIDAQGKVLEQGELNSEGRINFDRPNGEFSVIFDAGDSHHIAVFGDDIY